jgi:hypothetical protein
MSKLITGATINMILCSRDAFFFTGFDMQFLLISYNSDDVYKKQASKVTKEIS